jgi:hypothetical protein
MFLLNPPTQVLAHFVIMCCLDLVLFCLFVCLVLFRDTGTRYCSRPTRVTKSEIRYKSHLDTLSSTMWGQIIHH